MRVTDDGSVPSTVNAASVTTTVHSLTSGNAQLPLFTDGNSLYTGAFTANGSQMTGLAGRISVNPAVVANSSKLSVYSTLAADRRPATTRARTSCSRN